MSNRKDIFMLSNFIYMDDEEEVESVVNGLIEIINIETSALKFEYKKRIAHILIYREDHIYNIQEAYDNKENIAKEINNVKDLRQTLLLVLQACEESGDYEIVECAV